MKTMRATFEFEVPNGVSEKDVEEWLSFELRMICQLPRQSPLSSVELEATDIISIIEL